MSHERNDSPFWDETAMILATARIADGDRFGYLLNDGRGEAKAARTHGFAGLWRSDEDDWVRALLDWDEAGAGHPGRPEVAACGRNDA